MNNLNGGYVMIKHNATQTELANAYKTKKPVLLYDENGFAYWAKIKETTSIVDDETIYTYDVVKINQIENLVDSAGNLRFIDGEGTPLEQEGVDITYCKWSLSGTHLMLVVSGNLTNGTTIANGVVLAEYELPSFILDKIVPVWQQNLSFDIRAAYGSDGSNQQLAYFVQKTATSIMFKKSSSMTLTADRGFRIQFDLLIDADYSE